MTEGIDTNAMLEKIADLEETPTPVVEPEVKPVPLELCPHCGFDANKAQVHINENDRKEFYRCIMGMRPFTKQFELWNGDLVIEMTALNSKDTDAINKTLRTIQFEDNQAEMLELSIKLKILYVCKKVKTMEKEIEVEPLVNDGTLDIHAAFQKQFDIPETLVRLLSKTYMEFDVLVDLLNTEGFDENFYKGGGDA